MLKKLLLIYLRLLLLPLMGAFAQYSIHYTLKNLPDSKVYLTSIRGSRYVPIDSCVAKKGFIQFNVTPSMPVGVYRIVFADSLFTDVILNHENIVITNDMSDLLDNMQVIESHENAFYYSYWHLSSYINDTIQLISVLGDRIYQSSQHVMTSDLDSMARKAYQLTQTLNAFTNQLIEKSRGMFVNKLLKAYTVPDWEAYKKLPNVQTYKKRSDFLRSHFFDNIDFADTTLLYSEIFYVSCTDYLTDYVSVPSDTSYIKAVDFILSKPAENSPVYNYILNLFVNTFSDTEWEGTFVHLVDAYLEKNTCDQSPHNKTMSERAAVIHKLKPGNAAPEILMNDADGKPRSLFALKSKVVLLIFWSSECLHCEEVMAQICQLYDTYKSLGLEIFAVSADTDKTKWMEALRKNKMTWVNVCDLLGFQSPTIENYNAYSTPTFFVLDAQKIIVAHPYSPKEMSESINRAFNLQH